MAGLRDSTKAPIMAPKGQALKTRSIGVRLHHTRLDPRSRQCKDAPESAPHITAGCKMETGKANLEHLN